jgi:hypothetical protein
MAETKAQTKQLKIIPQRKEKTSRVYANYAEVTNNNIDVSLKFCDIRPPANDQELREANDKGFIHVPIEAEIALPKKVAEDLIRVLQVQLKGSSEVKN